MRKSNLYFFTTLCLLFGCAKKSAPPINSDYMLKDKGIKEFELDDNTEQQSMYYQYIDKGDSSYLAFVNSHDNSITINNFETGKLSQNIFFDKEGANGVGTVMNFCIKDSLIYLFPLWNPGVVISDFNACVKEKIKDDSDSFRSADFTPPIIFPMTLYPLSIVGDEIILPGYQGDHDQDNNNERERPGSALLNLKTKQMRFINKYPSVYDQGLWGRNPTYRWQYYTISENNEMVISYPKDGYIEVNNLLDGSVKRYYAGVEDMTVLEPISTKKDWRKVSITDKDEDEYYMEELSYGGILYDKKDKLYYRFALLPTYNPVKGHNRYNKKVQVIVLDSSFETVGRFDLPDENYSTGFSFISHEGLHIWTCSDNDDYMRFRTFKAEKK